jgi:hypothetical protein
VQSCETQHVKGRTVPRRGRKAKAVEPLTSAQRITHLRVAWSFLLGAATLAGVLIAYLSLANDRELWPYRLEDKVELVLHPRNPSSGTDILTEVMSDQLEGDRAIWIVGRLSTGERNWYPYGVADWDESRQAYVLLVTPNQIPRPQVTYVHAVLAEGPAHQHLIDYYEMKMYASGGWSDLPEGARSIAVEKP